MRLLGIFRAGHHGPASMLQRTAGHLDDMSLVQPDRQRCARHEAEQRAHTDCLPWSDLVMFLRGPKTRTRLRRHGSKAQRLTPVI